MNTTIGYTLDDFIVDNSSLYTSSMDRDTGGNIIFQGAKFDLDTGMTIWSWNYYFSEKYKASTYPDYFEFHKHSRIRLSPSSKYATHNL